MALKRTICNFWKNGFCERGESCGFAHGEHELGTTASGPAPAARAEKRTICRFWKEGHCKDGEQCTWAHGEHELGTTASGPVPAACAEKRTICRFWKEGHCKDGNQCTWAHGEHELGQQVPWAPAPTSRAAQRASPYPTAQHQSGAGLYKALPASLAAGFSAGFSGGYAAGPVRRAPLALAGGGQAGPAGAAPRRTVCRFWLEGFCKDGAQCTWAHGEHEIGTMPGAPETAGLASTKRTICKFFQDGFCERGSSCGFAHGAHEIGQPVPGANGYGVQRPSAVNFFAEPAGPVTTKRTLCKFFQDGHCKSGSACGFAHGAHEIGQAVPGASGYGVQWPSAVKAAPPATRRTMCRFNEQGRCERGDSCTFAHHEWQLGTPILQ